MGQWALVAIIVVLLIAAGLGVSFILAKKEAEKSRKLANEAEARYQALKKYEAIPNADVEAARVVQTAQAHAHQSTAQARATAQQLLSTAQAQAAEVVDNANALLTERQSQAELVLKEAREEAQRVAADALDARDKADHYERTARAMKNIVDGYGEDVWVPGVSLLDDLAEEFDFKEAGQRLKAARELTRAMIKEGHAADCDYKEKNRRATAIRFVADAFNGKVDSVLSKVRHDNFGKLEAQINDAFALVNRNGEAFKNARINKTYLAARQDELQWAVKAIELQRIEREEQRRIKDQMREEERARREYEKAIKAAEKEQKTLAQAMEAAREQLAHATAAQKSKFEKQLAELQAKLAEAEAKNQRALSMAQQTRRGHVYVISNVGSFGDDVFKIGLTRRLEPRDRVKELGDASVPFEFDIHAMIRAEDAPALEIELHKLFAHAQVNKVNPRKEFFRVAIAEIRKAVTAMGIQCQWTMVSEAREFRESEAVGRQRVATAAPSGSQRDPEAGSATAVRNPGQPSA